MTVMRPVMQRSPTGWWPLQVGGWLLFALAMSIGRAGEWPVAVILLIEWPFALLGFGTTLLLDRAFARVPFGTMTSARTFGFIVVGSWLAAMVWTAVFHTYLHQVAIPLLPVVSPEGAPVFRRGPLLDNSVYNTMVLLVWSTLRMVLGYRDALAIERAEALRAVAAARDAQLQMLAYQLNPHFLFNALNSLRALIHEDRDRAREMVTALSRFLRYAIVDRPLHLARLGEEVEALEGYLAIEKIRFEERLDVEVDVPDDAAACLVPAFLLNPLVENALKHGRPVDANGPLRVRIKAHLVAPERLVLTVENTGQLVAATPVPTEETGSRVGVRNVRARLAHLYPGDHHFTMSQQGEWVRVGVDLPTARRN
jgi:signal transduction histidine kinase